MQPGKTLPESRIVIRTFRTSRHQLQNEERRPAYRGIADRNDSRHPQRLRLGKPSEAARLAVEHAWVRVSVRLDEHLGAVVQSDRERLVDVASAEPARRDHACIEHSLERMP